MTAAPTYRDTLKRCCLFGIKWSTIAYLVIAVVLLLPEAFRDTSAVGIWGMIGYAAGWLVLLWFWGLVAAVLVSPLAHRSAMRRTP